MNNPGMKERLTGMAKHSLNMKETILSNKKTCRKKKILISRFCFLSCLHGSQEFFLSP